jgi:hypothetical protein
MANEITLFSGISAAKGNLNVQIPLETISVDLAGNRFVRNVQNVGTTFEALVVNDVSTAGQARFKNLDATNYVELGVDVSGTFYPVVRIDAGKTAGPFRLSTLTLHVRANTAAVNLECLVFEA